MKIVMTIMVRDEIDVMASMLEHHIAQGISHFIVTDNGSVDGTLQVLEEYRDRGLVDLHEDPVHQKQQTGTVTKMAREAYVEHGADWVINADADEFWVAVDPSVTLREALENTPTSIQSFQVPVVDMTGPPAVSGSGFDRLIYRDNRTVESLNEIGLAAHSTPDAVHIGCSYVNVSQGNHTVNLESLGNPSQAWAIEVLHLPWRSWTQFRNKVSSSGRAYETNPTLTPSPNHHGMREYRRFQDGILLPFYLIRHPTEQDIEVGLLTGEFVLDDRLRSLQAGSPASSSFDPTELDFHRLYGLDLARNEAKALKSSTEMCSVETKLRDMTEECQRISSELSALSRANIIDAMTLKTQILTLEDQIAQYRARFVVRFADSKAHLLRLLKR